jgi:hypothetical protein
MAAWRVARSLDTLLAQLNAMAPRRSKVSDGAIGDAAHATRESDHNPYIKLAGVGIVRARDFTNDPAGGLDCNWLAKALVASGDPRIRYIIWNRRIYTPGRGWSAYKGINAHEHHLHLSVSEQPGWFDSTLPWAGIGRSAAEPISTIGTLPVSPVQEDDMGHVDTMSDAVIDAIAERVMRRPLPQNQGIPILTLNEIADRVRGLTFPKPGSPLGVDVTEGSHYVPLDSMRLTQIYEKFVNGGQVSARDVAAALLPELTVQVQAAVSNAGTGGDPKAIATAVLDGLAARVAA